MTDLFGAYRSQTTKALQDINSSKYPDTNKDFEANLRRLNQFVDYIAQYLQTMQKGVDQANEDPITKLRNTITDMGTLFAGGELLYGINLGDLQYFLPALGALFGFDASQPFPINLLYAAEHFFLGYIIPLDAWAPAVTDIILGWAKALGLSPAFMQAVEDLLNAMGRFTNDLLGIFNDLFGFLSIFNLMNPNTPIGTLWHDLTVLLSQFNFTNLGHVVDPFLETLTPWIELLARIINAADDLIEAFTGGVGGGTGTMSAPTAWLNDFLGMFGGIAGLGTGSPNLVTTILGDIPFLNSIPFFGNLTSLLPGSTVGTGFDPQSIWNTVITDFLNPSGLLTAIASMDWGAIAQNLFGVSGITNAAGFSQLGTNFMSLLGNPNFNLPTSGFNPQSIWNSIITSFLNPSGLISAVMDWGSLALNLFGVGGITNAAGFGQLGTNLMALLGNPNFNLATGIFSPILSGQNLLTQVLTPAGALSTFTQLPGHLFGVLAPNNLTNMLPELGGFTSQLSFDDPSFWDGTVGRNTPLGSLKFTADGTYQQYSGVFVGADPSQVINVGVYAYWSSLAAAAGPVINLAVDAFDANQNLIPNPAGRIIMSITNPGSNSATYAGMAGQPPIPAQGTAGWDGIAVPGWVYLSGPYQPPAGTSYIGISPEITANAVGGVVHFDDGYLMPDQGLIDSSILTNFANLLDGSIPGAKVGGLQGIADIEAAFQHHVDGLFNAMNPGTPQTDVPFFTLFDMMQTTALNADNANTLGATNNNIVTNQISKQAITGGTQPSGEANATHATMPDTTTMPTTTLATGQAIAGWIRVGQNASKGFVDFHAAKAASGTTGIYMNLYKQNTSTGVKTRVYASPDLASLLPASTTTIASVSQMLIPGGLAVSQGDVLWGEIVNLSGSNLLVGKKSSPFPDHSSTYPRNFGHTRTVATLGQSPASLQPTDAATSQVAPILNFGIASVPANYHLPQQNSWPPSGSGAGTYVYTIPSFITTGDLIDLIGVGGGGSGMSEWNAGIMAGGVGGSWGAAQFVYGSDINGTGLTIIPAGTTQINVVVGAGGPQCSGYWQNGNPGSNTQFWIGTVGTGTLLLNCAGGPGGSGSVGLSNGTGAGPVPQTEVFDGKSYPGGGDVGINAPGAVPGGGGGGATWYEFGGVGAHGGAWAYAQKAP